MAPSARSESAGDASTARRLKTVCSHDCPDACSVLVDVRDGRAERFRGDPEHPFTRGFLCGKVNDYERIVYSPDRVLHPLRRCGAKGRGEFERISWEQAIEEIVAQLGECRETSGGESILQYFYGGTMGVVHRYSGDALFNRLGSTKLRANICYHGADAGYNAVVGGGYGVDPEDIVHSDCIWVWGCNVVATQVHLVPFIDAARKKGATLRVLDPYRNRTAQRADEWIPVRPGTDAALAFAMAHVIDAEGLADESFLRERSIGYERFREQVLASYTPGRASEITGVPAEKIRTLARELAAARAPVLKVGIGLGRSANGAGSVRAIACLAGVVGAYEKVGGGVLYDSGCEYRFHTDPLRRPDWRQGAARTLDMTDLAGGLLDWRDPPIRFLYVHSSNPAATAPDLVRLEKGLAREDLFTVVHERFLTDTCRFADIVLPAPTFAEVDDLYRSYGHLYLQMGRAVIAPQGESRPNLEVFQSIGRALGWTDPWLDQSVDDFARELLDTDDPNFDGIDVERVLAGETVRLNVPRGVPGFRDGFRTRSGKLEFSSDQPSVPDAPPVPAYRGDVFGEEDDRSRHPLRLVTPPAHHFLNSSFGASEASRRRQGGEPSLWIHPRDARAAGVADGDVVEAFNRLGTVQLVARVTDEVLPEVAIAEGTWWPWHGRNGHGINRLTSSRQTDFGGGSTFHDNRIGIRKAE